MNKLFYAHFHNIENFSYNLIFSGNNVFKRIQIYTHSWDYKKCINKPVFVSPMIFYIKTYSSHFLLDFLKVLISLCVEGGWEKTKCHRQIKVKLLKFTLLQIINVSQAWRIGLSLTAKMCKMTVYSQSLCIKLKIFLLFLQRNIF